MTEPGQARLECDLVMKGGITSGVIYPRLVEELSKVYDFRSIGGTSAGAIAAAGAAAAQLGVKGGGNPQAFAELGQLPDQLGATAAGADGSMLQNLFQPQTPFKGHFALLLASLGPASAVSKLPRLALLTLRSFARGAIVGALLPALLLLPFTWGPGFLIALVLVAIGALLGALIDAARVAGKALPGNAFGLCSGMPGEHLPAPALTPWLHRYLNGLAGKSGDAPLTFGELWAGRLRSGDEPFEVPDAAPRQIELAMITTALNLGRPFRLPFETGNLYFSPRELGKFLPAPVVDWMKTHARPFKSGNGPIHSESGDPLYPLPEPKDFPVVVAVRLSLSFPLLLSALPLYRIDYTLSRNQDRKDAATGAPRPPVPTKVWFSDGGICSNFPIHFFDSLLPRRPTFGINLKDYHPDQPRDRIWLPFKNFQGVESHFPAMPEVPGLGSIAAFLASIVRTMQRWRDEAQFAMPGFRDRIAHVCHTAEEGGMNLNMPPDVIRDLAAGGAQAASELVAGFATTQGTPNAWDNHQRIRLRTLLSQLQHTAEDLDDVLQNPPPEYCAVASDPTPPSYSFPNAATKDAAVAALQALQRFAQQLKASGIDLTKGAPRPEPELRIVPRV